MDKRKPIINNCGPSFRITLLW